MYIRWNNIPQVARSRQICRNKNLEDELNDYDLLEKLLKDTLREAGLSSSESMSIDIFVFKASYVILDYASRGDIDSQKILVLINQEGNEKARELLAYTAIALLEDYNIIRGGPKL